jgi:NAD+ kinase
MPLPLDLLLIRHGQSEGNAAKRLSEAGDNTTFNELVASRHTRSYRLSPLGQKQAEAAGEWLRTHFGTFDAFYTSEYTRAMETASLLNLPDAHWYRNFYLTERDWGDIEQCPDNERAERYAHALKMRTIEPFFWRPPNGESFAELCLRLDRVLDTLHRECANKRVVIVCHGEVIRAFRVLLERMPQDEFRTTALSKDKADGVFNCEIFHYTRTDPETKEVHDHLHSLRRIRPGEDPVTITPWQTIERKGYTNDGLMGVVNG